MMWINCQSVRAVQWSVFPNYECNILSATLQGTEYAHCVLYSEVILFSEDNIIYYQPRTDTSVQSLRKNLYVGFNAIEILKYDV